MAEHAFLPPSGAAAWVRCAMWPTMNAAYPVAGGGASEEGAAAHWVASTPGARVGDIAPNGVEVTDEMLEGAFLWDAALGPRHDGRRIEATVPPTPVISLDCWGTPDMWEVDGDVLRVADYKYGHGVVGVVGNWQLLTYAALILHAPDMPAEGIDELELVIVQPRGYGARGGPVRRWRVDLLDMPEYIRTLRDAADAARQESPTATPGTHCEYCPGRHACEALQRAGGHIMDYAGKGYRNDLTAAQVGGELRALDAAFALLDARRTGLQEQASAMLRQGEAVPHYRLTTTTGREEWAREHEEVLALGMMLGIPLGKPPVPVTPVQARKAGVPDGVVSAYSRRKPGAVKLVPDDGSDARRAFG